MRCKVQYSRGYGIPSLSRSMYSLLFSLASSAFLSISILRRRFSLSQLDMYIPYDREANKKPEEDLNDIVAYFQKRQAKNPYFYYDVRVNPEGRMVNLLWVNGKSRLSYDYFGDVIIFDSSHGLYRYKKSVTLTPILGVNHHAQWIFFGWALLLDQSEESFIWLFNSWLRAMHEKPPSLVITNPDQIVVNAIKAVFPNTRYKLSLWHMKGEFKSHIRKNAMSKKKISLREEFKRHVINSTVVDRFERDWEELVRDNDLADLEWVKELYQTRALWVPAYTRSAFAAGMDSSRSKQKLEPLFYFLNSLFLNDFTSLRHLVIRCERQMMNNYTFEKFSDFEARKMPDFTLGSSLEIHAGLVYTPILFSIFQEELIGSTRLIMKRIDKIGSCRKYQVSNPYCKDDSFLVTFDVSTYLGTCECQYYQYTGILCSHILTVLHRKNVLEIPKHFIMQRWTKEANKGAQFSVSIDPTDPNAPALRKAAVYRCVNYCKCIAEQCGDVDSSSTYTLCLDRIIRDICSTQIADWVDSEDIDYDNYSSYSEVSEPIDKEDIEYIASVAERSADAYKVIIKGLEELMRDLSSNLRFADSEEAQYSEELESSEEGRSVKEEFENVCQPYAIQMDEGNDAVENKFGEPNDENDAFEGEFGDRDEDNDEVEGEFGEWNEHNDAVDEGESDEWGEELGSDGDDKSSNSVGENGEWDENLDSDEAASELDEMQVDGSSESGSGENGESDSDVSGESVEMASENECECSLCRDNGFHVCTCLSIGH